MNDFLTNDNLKKLFIATPLFVIFFSNIFITQIKGLLFIGEIAVLAGISSLIAIFIGHRSDIEILSNPQNQALNNLKKSLQGIIMLIIFLVPILVIAYSFFGFQMKHIIVVLLSASFALNDSISSYYMRNERFFTYSIIRSFPSLFLLAAVFFFNSANASWITSYLFSLLLISVISIKNVKGIEFNFQFFKVLRYLSSKFIPTLTAIICASGTVFWLLIISDKAGSEAAGIWSNVYRIFSLPIIFLTATFLPLVLLKIGDVNNPFLKIMEMHYFSSIFFFISLVIVFSASLFGQEIFIFFTKSNVEIPIFILLAMIMFAVFKNFIGYHQTLFQSLNRDIILLSILIVELIAALVLFLNTSSTKFEAMVEYVFYVTGSCALLLFVVLTILTYKFYYSKKG